MVAKSYQGLPFVCNPYKIGTKTYVKVRKLNGDIIQVRFYTEDEYRKWYGDPTIAPKSQKEAFGFANDFITIFCGDSYPHKDYLKTNGAKYNPAWGWYFPGGDELPTIPADLKPVRLDWDTIGNENGLLKGESIIKAEVAKLLHVPSTSKFVGEIGQRRDFKLRVTRAIPLNTYYGGTMYSFEDDNKNVFVWRASSAQLTVGTVQNVRGTIKAHNIYNDVEQTVLTRCSIISK